jgi:hypothetical protein
MWCSVSGGSCQQVRLRVAVCLFLGELAVFDQALNVRVIGRAAHQIAAAKMVDARVARMNDVALPGRAQEKRGHGAVGLFLGRDCGQLDHEMRIEHELLEQLRGILAVRHEALEKLTRGENHLVGCFAAAALAPHAVGNHSQRTARDTRMRNDFDLILLVLPITPMLARRGHEAIALLGRAHGRKL